MAKTAKVRIVKNAELAQDDSLRNLFVQSVKEYSESAQLEMAKKDFEAILKELLELAGPTIKITIDTYVDIYMSGVEEEEKEGDGKEDD